MEIENVAFYLAFSGSLSTCAIIVGHAVSEMKRVLRSGEQSTKKS